MSKATSKTEKMIPYENNPFNVATLGLKLFFTLALPIALVAATLSILSFYSQMRPSEFFDTQRYHSYSNTETKSLSAEEQLEARFDDIRNEIVARKDKIERMTGEQWTVVIAVASAVILLILFIGTLFGAMFDYTAAQMRRGKSVTLSDAMAGATERFFPYLWLRILVAIKVFLWTLLFIIPGIIMGVRYSLAGVSFYDKKLGANAAIKDSSRLVKGAWLTTNGSQVLFNLITLGMMQIVLQPGTSSVLYRQLDEYDKADKTKPKAHILSWLTLIIPCILLILFVLLLLSALIYLLQTQ